MPPDVNSLGILDPVRLKAAWAADVERLADHYGFDADQRKKAQSELADAEAYADMWFQDKERQEKRLKYFAKLRKVQAVERDLHALSFEREPPRPPARSSMRPART